MQNRPFAVIGIDYAGPLYCKNSRYKWYILLVTCGVSRALHLELAPTLKLKDFFNCFSRFCSRRQVPEIIISDNAATFVAASNQMSTTYGPLAPKWSFIPPRAPWWGGWYERLVRSVKNGLKKSIGLRHLNRTDLEVVLLRVEAAINTRPLTKSCDTTPLRPNDFLHPHHGVMLLPDKELEREVLEELQATQKKAVVEVWTKWQNNYIVNLPHLISKHFTNKELEVCDLVLINDKHFNKNRLTWPLGRITKLFPGRDNKVRSVEIQTQSGLLVRAIQSLHKLELSKHDFSDNETTLSGRVITSNNNNLPHLS